MSDNITFKPSILKFISIWFGICILFACIGYWHENCLVSLKILFWTAPLLMGATFFILSFFVQFIHIEDGMITIESLLSVLLWHKFQTTVMISSIKNLSYVSTPFNMETCLKIQTSDVNTKILGLFFAKKDFKQLLSSLTSLTFLPCEIVGEIKEPRIVRRDALLVISLCLFVVFLYLTQKKLMPINPESDLYNSPIVWSFRGVDITRVALWRFLGLFVTIPFLIGYYISRWSDIKKRDK